MSIATSLYVRTHTIKRSATFGFALTSLFALSACDESGKINLGEVFKPKEAGHETLATAATGGKTVERDVEAPEVFSATEAGLWDGRPSLGGVWVAYPGVKDPERVIIRNTSNGKFVVGALFRRERDIPGPKLQISSDAAEALGMLAGAPSELNVTALRREEVPVEAPAAPVEVDAVAPPSDVSETPLDPIAAAGAAIDAAAPSEGEAPSTEVAAAEPAPKPAPAPQQKSKLDKPYIQVGIFSVEANAKRTAEQMRSAGVVPTVRKGETAGKPFWRVIVGPSGNKSERSAVLKQIKGAGFTDAYPVTN